MGGGIAVAPPVEPPVTISSAPAAGGWGRRVSPPRSYRIYGPASLVAEPGRYVIRGKPIKLTWKQRDLEREFLEQDDEELAMILAAIN